LDFGFGVVIKQLSYWTWNRSKLLLWHAIDAMLRFRTLCLCHEIEIP